MGPMAWQWEPDGVQWVQWGGNRNEVQWIQWVQWEPPVQSTGPPRMGAGVGIGMKLIRLNQKIIFNRKKPLIRRK